MNYVSTNTAIILRYIRLPVSNHYLNREMKYFNVDYLEREQADWPIGAE